MGVRLPALILLGLLAGCHQPAAEVEAAGEAASAPVAAAQAAAVSVSLPVVEAVQDVAQTVADVLPGPPPPKPAAVAPAAVALIVRWEVTSPSRYTAKYQGVICPGGASGPTWGIGYDGGTQTVTKIVDDWRFRDDRFLLATASGQTGETRCASQQAKLRAVRVPYPEAYGVFADKTLPEYQRATRRALPGVDQMPPNTEGATISVGYNRGWSMLGSRGIEKRAIRDDCVPRGDVGCVAAQIRAMKRLWPTVKGLRDRREDEARLAESTG